MSPAYQLFFPWIMPFYLKVTYKKSLHPSHLCFLLCHLLGVLSFLWLVICSVAHIELIFTRKNSLYLVSKFNFCMWIDVQYHLLERKWYFFLFSPPLCCLCSCQRFIDCIYVLLFCPFIYLSFLLSIPHHLNYYGFIVSISLKVSQYQLSNFVLLKYCVGYLQTFVSPYKPQNQFIDSHKMTCWYLYLDFLEFALNH